jgi:hypothetical protein
MPLRRFCIRRYIVYEDPTLDSCCSGRSNFWPVEVARSVYLFCLSFQSDKLVLPGSRRNIIGLLAFTLNIPPAKNSCGHFTFMPCRKSASLCVQSTDQEISPGRNAIYAHAQDFPVSDELLLANLKAFVPQPLK